MHMNDCEYYKQLKQFTLSAALDIISEIYIKEMSMNTYQALSQVYMNRRINAYDFYNHRHLKETNKKLWQQSSLAIIKHYQNGYKLCHESHESENKSKMGGLIVESVLCDSILSVLLHEKDSIQMKDIPFSCFSTEKINFQFLQEEMRKVGTSESLIHKSMLNPYLPKFALPRVFCALMIFDDLCLGNKICISKAPPNTMFEAVHYNAIANIVFHVIEISPVEKTKENRAVRLMKNTPADQRYLLLPSTSNKRREDEIDKRPRPKISKTFLVTFYEINFHDENPEYVISLEEQTALSKILEDSIRIAPTFDEPTN